MTLPVALTMGDPAGIGPEIAVRARQELGAMVPFVMLADVGLMARACAGSGISVAEVADAQQALQVAADQLPVLPIPLPEPAKLGKPDLANAKAVIESIERAVALVHEGACAAVCTNPISKQVLRDGADFDHPGHTEFLAALSGGQQPVMMLAAPELKVVPATIHIPLAEVPNALTRDLIMAVARTLHAALRRDFGIRDPKIAVAGLNPHAGEGGHIGIQEQTLIQPALDTLRAEGLNLMGPLSADTMFHDAARAGYDAALCMYHDQALIPLKTLNFSGGVNVTLGLPIVRTSPDHGTAFDIAGQGIADPTSLIAALRMAADIGARRASASA